MSSRRRTRGTCMYDTHTYTHVHSRRRYICIAETRRPCKFNICAVMEWSCRSGGNRVCAYLTQMLKLSYALQYHEKLRRIDGTRARKRYTKALGIYPHWIPYYEYNPFRGKSTLTREMRGGEEMKKRIKFKPYSNLIWGNAASAHISQPRCSVRCYGWNEELYTTLLCHDTTFANRNPYVYHLGI